MRIGENFFAHQSTVTCDATMMIRFPSNWKLFILNIRTLHIFYDVRKRHTRFLFVQRILELPAEHDRLIRFVLLHSFFFCSRIFISIECLLKVLESANSCYYCGFSVSFQLDRNRNEPDDTADGRKRIVVMPYSSQPLISSMRCALRNRICVVMHQPWMNYVRIGRDSCFHCTISLLFSNGQPNAIIILFLRRSCCSYALWWFRCIAQYLWSLDRPVGGRQLYKLWINSVSVRVQYALS